MAKKDPFDDDIQMPSQKKGGNGLLIVGLAVGALVLLTCCGGVSVGAFLVYRASGPTDIVGRWENNDLGRMFLDFRPDGTGSFEVPDARVRIAFHYKLRGDELTITAAPGKALDVGERMALERLERTRVSRTANQLRMDALAGPGQGQAMLLKKIG